jgi:hypothetical protein
VKVRLFKGGGEIQRLGGIGVAGMARLPDKQREQQTFCLKMEDAMSIESDWAERVRRLASEYDEQIAGHQLIHRNNFDLFIATETVPSWQQFQEVFTGRFQERGWAFRGHEKWHWRLETALERACLRTVTLPGDPPIIGEMLMDPDGLERDLLLRFQRRAHQYIQNPPDDADVLDWLAFMQHHGVPTRLMDWTLSPYVALYFALENSRPDTDCAVWAIDTYWLREKATETLRVADPRFPTTMQVRAFNQYLNGILFSGHNPNVVVVADPIKMNERAAAQQGMFLYDLSHTGAFDIPLLQMLVLPTPPPLPVIWKFRISTAERVHFLRELNWMNINGASLFPGLDGFARSLRLYLEGEADRLLKWTAGT